MARASDRDEEGAQVGNEHAESMEELARKIDWKDVRYRDTIKLLFQLYSLPEKAPGAVSEFPGQTGTPIPGYGYAFCQVCQEPEGYRGTLLCDGCDKSIHISCMGLQPEHARKIDEWFCQSCCISGASQTWPLGKVDHALRTRRSLEGGRKGMKELFQRNTPETPGFSKITQETNYPLGGAILQIEGRELDVGSGSQSDNLNNSRSQASSLLYSDDREDSIEGGQNQKTRKRPREENEIESGPSVGKEASFYGQAENSDGCSDLNVVSQSKDWNSLLSSNGSTLKHGDEVFKRSKICVASKDENLEVEGRATSTGSISASRFHFESRNQVPATSLMATPVCLGDAPAAVNPRADSCLPKSDKLKPSRARSGGSMLLTDVSAFEEQERFRRLEVVAVEQLHKYVADRNGVLEDGWRADVTKRKKGKGSTVRTHYVSPNGRVFKSRVQVAEYLGLPKALGNSQEISEMPHVTTRGVRETMGQEAALEESLPHAPKPLQVWEVHAPKPIQIWEVESTKPAPFQPPEVGSLAPVSRQAQQVQDQAVVPLLQSQALSIVSQRDQVISTSMRSEKEPLQLLEQYMTEMNGHYELGKEGRYFSPDNRIFQSRIQIARHLGLIKPLKGRCHNLLQEGKNKELGDTPKGSDSGLKVTSEGVEESESVQSFQEDACDEPEDSDCDTLTEDDILRNIREFMAEQKVLLQEEAELKKDRRLDNFVPRKRARVRSCLDIARQLGASGLKNLQIRAPDTGT